MANLPPLVIFISYQNNVATVSARNFEEMHAAALRAHRLPADLWDYDLWHYGWSLPLRGLFCHCDVWAVWINRLGLDDNSIFQIEDYDTIVLMTGR